MKVFDLFSDKVANIKISYGVKRKSDLEKNKNLKKTKKVKVKKNKKKNKK